VEKRLLNILVVDDEPMVARVVLRILEGILEADGYTVVTIIEAGEHGFGSAVRTALAQAKAEGEPFDILVSDIGLNGENGCAIVAEALKEYRDLRVFVMSGADSHLLTDELRALIAGFIPKPFTTGDFRAVLKPSIAAAQ